MRRAFQVLAVALPILMMAAWVAQQLQVRTYGDAVILRVTGYDPRDLLSGHYLRYQVQYGDLLACSGKLPKMCVCLDQTDQTGIAEASWFGSCSERPADCERWLAGRCSWSRFEAGIERYYFPDKFQAELRMVPPDATIEVRLDGSGSGIVSGFFIAGVPLLDFAASEAAKTEIPPLPEP